MHISPEEKLFFAGIAEQASLEADTLIARVAEQISNPGGFDRPCVTFADNGSVVGLDLSRFPSLQDRQERIRVDCSPLRRLQSLRIFHRDVDLEVRNNRDLRTVSIDFCRQETLALPEQVEELSCAGNPLMEFQAQSLPKLRKLNLAYTPLESIDVSMLRDLEDFECGWNDNSYYREGWSGPRLKTLEIGALPRLKRINAQNWLYPKTPSGQRLEFLDVSGAPALEQLIVSHHELRELDVRSCRELRVLSCEHNPLVQLDLTQNLALEALAVEGTQVATLELGHLRELTSLQCGGKTLRSVVVAGARKLRAFTCRGAPVESLGLAGLPELESVYLQKCKLTTLDVSSSPKLRELTASGCRKLGDIQCSELQKQTVPGLRKFFKLSKPTKNPAKMDPYALHEFVSRYNWDQGTSKLIKAIRNPDCSLASALLVYWMARPHWYLQYEDDAAAMDDVTGREVLPLIREIERRAKEGAYRHHPHIPWSADEFTDDPYPELPKKRELPDHMLTLSSSEHAVE